MDYNKIGQFIANERKSKNLTQAKLAEQIFVSEKTISKWESGKGIPDTNSLLLLCKVLDVDFNELVAGERNVKNSKNKNEELLVQLAKEVEDKNRTIWISMWIIMGVSIVAMMGGMLMAAYFIPSETWKIITIIISAVIFFIPCFYALKLEVSIGVYKCKKCGTEIVPTYAQALGAKHMGTTRHLKCPTCNRRTWCKKVIHKKEEQ